MSVPLTGVVSFLGRAGGYSWARVGLAAIFAANHDLHVALDVNPPSPLHQSNSQIYFLWGGGQHPQAAQDWAAHMLRIKVYISRISC